MRRLGPCNNHLEHLDEIDQCEKKQLVSVTKSEYATNRKDYLPVMYEIEINDDSITGITEEAAKMIHHELGKFLYPNLSLIPEDAQD